MPNYISDDSLHKSPLQIDPNGTMVFSDKLTRLDNQESELIQLDVEYTSPQQHGGLYGLIIRRYIENKTNNQVIASGVSLLLGYSFIRYIGEATTPGYPPIENYTIHTGGDSENYLKCRAGQIRVYGNLHKGWVDYIKSN